MDGQRNLNKVDKELYFLKIYIQKNILIQSDKTDKLKN